MDSSTQQPQATQAPGAFQYAGPQQQPNVPFYQQGYQQVPPPGYAAAPPANTPGFLGLNVNDTRFWKGVIIGAAVALLVTNESVQRGVVKAVAKLTAAAQSGIEEMKEKFEDAKAEADAEK